MRIEKSDRQEERLRLAGQVLQRADRLVGNIAVRQGVVRNLGRSATDVMRTGGYKVSALEVEQELLAHPALAECGVVGLPDPEWGERVAAAIRLRTGKALELAPLRDWCRARLAVYKIPSRLQLVEALPRNAMGKVLKRQVAEAFAATS